jgi:hypothetical protein|tara:strand:- start:11 stop:322 length:312 start_codon:yes stop_codon:yes gene_type:complete
MKYIFFHKNNKIKFYSKGIKVSKSSLPHKIINLKKSEEDKLKENYDLSIKGNKLIFTEAPHQKKLKKEKDRKDTLEQVKELKGQIKDMAAKDAIDKILKIIES